MRYYTSIDEQVVPSQFSEYEWLQYNLYEDSRDAEIPDTTGKWMIFSKTLEDADTLWPILKNALYNERLGSAMKCATKTSSNGVLTCIYTYCWYNIADIKRVLSAMRDVGINHKIFYKADEQTHMGISGSIYVSVKDTHVEITKKGYEWFKLTGISIPHEL